MNSSTARRAFLGVAAAVPIGSVLQGCYFLTVYRRDHGDSPVPLCPSSGVVVVRPKIRTSINQNYPRMLHQNFCKFCEYLSGKLKNLPFHTSGDQRSTPLRLLVVGDSLAAGVGITKRASPILPETIAKALSLELGGRPVYYTCIGTPGASTRRIIHDLELFHRQQETYDQQNRNTSQGLATWVKLMVSFMKWIIRNDGDDHSPPIINLSHSNQIPQKQHLLGSIWDSLDIIKSKIQHLMDTFNKHTVEEASTLEWKKWKDSHIASHTQYDIVIVLTGMNDFKSMFLPFLTDARFRNTGSFKEELENLFTLLKSKMKFQINEFPPDTKPRSDKQKRMSLKDKTIIVLPAIPSNPIIKFIQYPPLSWMVWPLFQMMEAQKRYLALENPDSILYVEEPSIEVLRQVENGEGMLHSNDHTETIVFNVTDISQNVTKQIEDIMVQYVERYTKSKMHDEVERSFEEAYYTQKAADFPVLPTVGSSLLSYDRLHPNEDGYEFYGRHIAAAVIQAWKQHRSINQ